MAAFAVGLAVTMVAAYLPARRSGRIPPIAALRDDVAMPESALRWRVLTGTLMTVAGVVVGGVGRSRTCPNRATGSVPEPCWPCSACRCQCRPPPSPSCGWPPRPTGGSSAAWGSLAGQNSLRNPRRTAATASALMIGLTIVTTMSIAATSTKASVDATISRTFLGRHRDQQRDRPGVLDATSPSRSRPAWLRRDPAAQRLRRPRAAARLDRRRRPDRRSGPPATLTDAVVRLQLGRGIDGRLQRHTVLESKEEARRSALEVRQALYFEFHGGDHAAHRRHPGAAPATTSSPWTP